MFGSSNENICACWNGLIRPFGESMKTWMPRFPRIAYSGGAARVARRRSQDVERARALAERVLEEIAQELHRDVLESERRPIRCVQQVHAGFQFRHGGDRVGAENRLRVRAVDQRLEIGLRNVGHEPRQDRVRKSGVRQAAEAAQLRARKTRIFLRHGQAAVGCQAFKQDGRERLLGDGPRAARREVSHVASAFSRY
jgi:hypothetical protein